MQDGSEPVRKLVFLSHINEEKEVAIAFKELVEASFLNMIEVFVSSDGASILMGDKWLDVVGSSLKTCAIEVIACSPISVTRPWVNFEAGAGWVRGIPVIPLCHSGMTPATLPIPLKLLNAATASDPVSLSLVLPVLARALGSSVPNPNFEAYLKRIVAFESRYTFWDRCNECLRMIDGFHVEMLTHLKTGKTVTVPIDQRIVEKFEAHAEFLREHEVVNYLGREVMIMGPVPKIECKFAPMRRLLETLADPECQV